MWGPGEFWGVGAVGRSWYCVETVKRGKGLEDGEFCWREGAVGRGLEEGGKEGGLGGRGQRGRLEGSPRSPLASSPALALANQALPSQPAALSRR